MACVVLKVPAESLGVEAEQVGTVHDLSSAESHYPHLLSFKGKAGWPESLHNLCITESIYRSLKEQRSQDWSGRSAPPRHRTQLLWDGVNSGLNLLCLTMVPKTLGDFKHIPSPFWVLGPPPIA